MARTSHLASRAARLAPQSPDGIGRECCQPAKAASSKAGPLLNSLTGRALGRSLHWPSCGLGFGFGFGFGFSSGLAQGGGGRQRRRLIVGPSGAEPSGARAVSCRALAAAACPVTICCSWRGQTERTGAARDAAATSCAAAAAPKAAAARVGRFKSREEPQKGRARRSKFITSAGATLAAFETSPHRCEALAGGARK